MVVESDGASVEEEEVEIAALTLFSVGYFGVFVVFVAEVDGLGVGGFGGVEISLGDEGVAQAAPAVDEAGGYFGHFGVEPLGGEDVSLGF